MTAQFDALQSRGALNHNPGNIDRASWVWNGEIRDAAQAQNDCQRRELTAGRFCVFGDMRYGIRALILNLHAYQVQLGLLTIRQMIDKWAPPGENDTAAYIAAVCMQTGFGPDEPVDVEQYVVAKAMVDAITRVECGGMPYTDAVMDEGLGLAGIHKGSLV